MSSKDQAKDDVKKLVDKFAKNFSDYKLSTYNETQVRRDFIDPFFKAFGWDMDNSSSVPEAYRDVIHEDKIRIAGQVKSPDYSFRLRGKRYFFVEAKKPFINIEDDASPAYQLKRYAWSAKLKIGIVTDFEEFAVYDCSSRPDPEDRASVARIRYFKYTDYVQNFDFIWDLFSNSAIINGSHDHYIANEIKKGNSSVDDDFLQSLDRWRTKLAKDIFRHNNSVSELHLNQVVQNTIDRIIFLRIAEDRNIEHYGNLKKCMENEDVYTSLLQLFRAANEKYNSGLFDFDKDSASSQVEVSDDCLREIIDELYFPQSPYEFSVIPVEILGSAYEQFLGKTIQITNNRIRVEDKPDVRKAGGVFYTPTFVVDYIVHKTVGKMIEGKTPAEISKFRIIDPSSGSGSFLLGAYDCLLKYHRDWYLRKNKKYRSSKDNPLNPDGSLKTEIKKSILLNNIFGVDIDSNAVEVTKLSLLLKCLEGETQASIQSQLSLFNERILPTLDSNIKCGNSLVDTDYFERESDPDVLRKIKPFSWRREFREVMNSGGFDVVIGNPPYGHIEDENLKAYLPNRFKSAEGRYDNFEFFVEQGMTLLRSKSNLGYIIPSPVLTNLYSRKLRELLLTNYRIEEIVNFDMPVFEDPTIHTCIVILNSTFLADNSIAVKSKVNSTDKLLKLDSESVLQAEFLKVKNFVIDIFMDGESLSFFKRLEQFTTPLGELCYIRQCIKTGNDPVYVKKSATKLADPWKKSLRGKSIARYRSFEKDLYLKYGKWLARNWKNKSFYETNKIAIRETGNRITAALDLKKSYFLSSLYALYYKDSELNDREHLMFLLGIINSKFANYFIKIIAFNLTKGAFTKVRTNQLARLPIVSLNQDNPLHVGIFEGIVDAVAKLTELDQSGESERDQFDHFDNKVDALVYKLYGLSDDEIRLIEENSDGIC